MHKIMIIYPPGRLFQRGEDRCQIDISASSVNTNRPCNDLGYVSAILKNNNYSTFLKDYQGEKSSIDDLVSDFEKENPDLVFMSITNGSILDDLKVVDLLKSKNNDTVFILKGSIFFNPNAELLSKLNLSNIDYLIGGEVEFIIDDLVNAHFQDKNLLKNIQGISYKDNENNWIINPQLEFKDELENLPFPDRESMHNELYINPETNLPMALIVTDKGCPYSCSYCLSPVISGKKIRTRSNENIIKEIKECVEKYNITNFFFKSDTFTANKAKILDFCKLLISEGLNKKINWVATARVNNIDDELIKLMKQAGCSLVAIGFESGSNESLSLMNKKTTTEMNLKAAKICKKYKLEILGYFLIGFPWEDERHLSDMKKHIFAINADYIEISVVVPFPNTPIYNELVEKNTDLPDITGFDSYNNIYKKYGKLPAEKIAEFRKQTLLQYYTRPSYIIKKLLKIKSFSVFINYVKYGLKMLKNSIC
ncbi:radical SAM protein [bacterium]|nr:radical SAM protein [bacterium]